jgi:hypothetical protein
MTKGVLALATLLGVVVGCGGSSSSNPTPVPTPSPTAVMHITIDPSPIYAVDSGDKKYPWDFTFNVEVYDSGGVGFTITKLQYVVASAQTGFVLDTVDSKVNGTHYGAFGRVVRQYHETPYSMENSAREAKVTVNYNIVDDNLHHFDGSTVANVLLGEIVVRP